MHNGQAGGGWCIQHYNLHAAFSYLTRQRTGLPLGGINVVVKLKYKDEFN